MQVLYDPDNGAQEQQQGQAKGPNGLFGEIGARGAQIDVGFAFHKIPLSRFHDGTILPALIAYFYLSKAGHRRVLPAEAFPSTVARRALFSTPL